MANIMDYIPQFKDNTYDLSGYGDDATQQLDLKRKLRMAQALQGQQVPEGQIVSGRYVAPSWTQYLANAAGKVMGAQDERRAIQDYAKVQSAKTQKLADLLKGQEVEQPVDYNEAGNMPGITQTVRKPFSQQEFTSRAVQLMPDLAPKLVETQLAQYGKEEQPISLSEGGILVNRKGDIIAQNPKSTKPQPKYSNVTRDENTGKFYGLNDQGQVEEIGGARMSPKPQAAPTVRTMRVGSMDVTQQWNPQTQKWEEVARGTAFKPEQDGGMGKPPAGYRWTDEGGLAPIPGGPGDPNTKFLTQDAANARLYGTRMQESDNIIKPLEVGGKVKYSPMMLRAIVTGPTGISDAAAYMADESTQQAAQAMRNFINATLRRESGATITPVEFDNAIKQYFPQPGESQSIIEQKQRNRATAIQGITAAGYPGGVVPNQSQPQNQSQTPPLNLLSEGQNTTFKNGQVWTLQNGKAKRVK